MNKKLKVFWYVVLYIPLALMFFVGLSSSLLQMGRHYGDAFFPITYPVVGGYFISDWVPWFSAAGFIFGWLPFVLFRKNNRKDRLTIPLVVVFTGLLILFIASISIREDIWRYILNSVFVSAGFGMIINIVEDRLQEL